MQFYAPPDLLKSNNSSSASYFIEAWVGVTKARFRIRQMQDFTKATY